LEHRTGLSIDEAQSALARTLDLYRREFGEEPPHDIWPGDAEMRRAALGQRIAYSGFLVSLLGWSLGFAGTSGFAGASIGISPAIAVLVGVGLFFGGFLLLMIAAYVGRGTDLTEIADCA